MHVQRTWFSVSRPPLNNVTPCEQFYGFVSSPFNLTPDLRFAYDSRSHIAAFEQVTDALRHREGLIVITGEIGTGKTMLCRSLLRRIWRARTFLSVILDPCLTVDDFCIRSSPTSTLFRAARGRRPVPPHRRRGTKLVTTLQHFLASLIPLNAHAVIMIDEAQHLDPVVLEQIPPPLEFRNRRCQAAADHPGRSAGSGGGYWRVRTCGNSTSASLAGFSFMPSPVTRSPITSRAG